MKIIPNRDALNARWRIVFNQPRLETRCWEIAASTPWILEGLAAYASGQWADYASSARSALHRRDDASAGLASWTLAQQ